MTYEYTTHGTCARRIEYELDGGVVKNIRFIGGCSGNTQGVARLVEGLSVEEVQEKLAGIRCGFKSTSCPDQLAKAVAAAAKQLSEG